MELVIVLGVGGLIIWNALQGGNHARVIKESR
jgi:hypothetical protein